MKNEVILKVENISKQYRLGIIGTGTISHDLNRWWHKIRGKEDPFFKIGETNNRDSKGESEYVWALKDINFEVKRGEVLGIIGKNGAGKSTLLKILSKVTAPSTGIIKSGGRIASLLEVGTGFHPEMTGKENVFLNGAILGMTKKEICIKLDEIIEFSGCERYINTPVKRYSSGMKVRLAFAVAAFLEPDVLVVDEVLAVGDAEFQKKAIGKMKDISKQGGRTVLFVSHDMTAIKSLCSTLLVLHNGMVSFTGSVESGINHYLKNNVRVENSLFQKGNILIKEFRILKEDNEISMIEVFDPVSLKIKISFLEIIPTDFKIEFIVTDAFGQIQTAISSWLNAIQITPKDKEIEMEVVLKSGFSLNAGEYSIDVKTFGVKMEYFENIINFDLINSEYTGYKLPLKPQFHGKTFTPNDWK